MYERILVPLDGSKEGEAAIPCVRNIAEKSNSDVVLLHATGLKNGRERPLKLNGGEYCVIRKLIGIAEGS